MDRNVKFVGIDMGDVKHCVCMLDGQGDIVGKVELENTGDCLRKYFGGLARCVVTMEAGTHARWCAAVIAGCGHEVLVGNPRHLRVIWKSDKKNDWHDAEMLARVGRVDRSLLHPVCFRSDSQVYDLAVVKARDKLVKTRTQLVCHMRGTVKTCGGRISNVSSKSFCHKCMEQVPKELEPALEPVNDALRAVTEQIGHCDKQIGQLCLKYPETARLQAIAGVGPITSLAFVLTLGAPDRCKSSRDVGSFLGLTPRRDQSGQTDKQLPITKAGNGYLRRLLVGSAQYLLGPFGKDCELRRRGLKLAERGGKNAKRRAVVATARKLATVMHAVWKSQGEYDPSHHANRKSRRDGAVGGQRADNTGKA